MMKLFFKAQLKNRQLNGAIPESYRSLFLLVIPRNLTTLMIRRVICVHFFTPRVHVYPEGFIHLSHEQAQSLVVSPSY